MFVKSISRLFEEIYEGVSRVFEGFSMQSQMILNMFHEGSVRISSKFPGYFMDVLRMFQVLVRVFQGFSVFKVHCCMSFIAATQAEVGLVLNICWWVGR